METEPINDGAEAAAGPFSDENRGDDASALGGVSDLADDTDSYREFLRVLSSEDDVFEDDDGAESGARKRSLDKTDGDAAPGLEEAALPSASAQQQQQEQQQQTTTRHPPSFFTNERGNLKAVSFVVRHPCAVFAIVLGTCVLVAFLLQVMVLRTADNYGFTLPTRIFQMNDVRSIRYDSFRLARDEVLESRRALEVAGKGGTVRKQSEPTDALVWVFESSQPEDGTGVFGSAELCKHK